MARQTKILGMRVQREYKGPAARLVELLDPADRNHIGIVFYEQYRNHSALTDSLDGLMSFLQTPVARGITPLHSYGYEEGAFIYETGKCKSVAELIRQASDLGLSPGPRAGLELMTQAMEVLHGALRIAEEYAIFSHGGLTPWRLMIRPDGKLQVIGFAVPQVEVLDYKSNPNLVPSEDSFRYAPPERMEMDAMEDFSSDLFAVALIGFEMMTTRPMYDGSISAIQESAQRADVSMRLNQAMVSGWLDPHTHDFLDQCLRLDSEDRFDSFSTAIRAGKTLLRNQHLKGMSLFDLMSASSQQILRSSQEVEMLDAATAMFDRNALNPEILELEAERKRQKLKEITLGENQEPIDETQTAEMNTIESNNPANLLDMLRQSNISAPEVPVIQTPPPKPQKPQSALGDDLLSALRSSVSQTVDHPEGIEPAAQEGSNSSTETSPNSNQKASDKLASILSTPKRATPSMAATTDSTPSLGAGTDTANKLTSLLSAPKRPQQSVSKQSVEIEKDVQENSTQKPSIPQSTLTQSIMDATPHLFGERLDEEFPDELSDEDCATTIMARPSTANAVPESKKSRERNAKAPAQSKSKSTVKSKPLEQKGKAEISEDTPQIQQSKLNSSSEEINTRIEPKPAPPTAPQQFSDLQDLFGSPIPLRSTFPTINAQKYKISLGAGRGSIKQVCSPEITVAQLVSILLLNRLLPNRMDLSGQLTSCYRVKDRGEVVSGKRTLSSLKKTQLMLTSVPTRTLLVPIEVHSPDGLIRFNTPINWIVPMGSIIDYVVSWLRLPVGNWRAYIGDVSMDVHDVIFDVYEEGESCTIILKQGK